MSRKMLKEVTLKTSPGRQEAQEFLSNSSRAGDALTRQFRRSAKKLKYDTCRWVSDDYFGENGIWVSKIAFGYHAFSSSIYITTYRLTVFPQKQCEPIQIYDGAYVR